MSELRRRHMNPNKAFQSLMEFGAMIRYHATDKEDKWKLASKLCEGLTGESLKVAMALGIDKLSQKDGVLKLVEALRLHMFGLICLWRSSLITQSCQ